MGGRDFTDYGAGAFPDMVLSPKGNPVLVYFNEASSTGQLKAMLCSDPMCAQFRVVTLSSGQPGYGRDCSVGFAEQSSRMLVSFLDLQGKDTLDGMVARLAVLEAQ